MAKLSFEHLFIQLYAHDHCLKLISTAVHNTMQTKLYGYCNRTQYKKLLF